MRIKEENRMRIKEENRMRIEDENGLRIDSHENEMLRVKEGDEVGEKQKAYGWEYRKRDNIR